MGLFSSKYNEIESGLLKKYTSMWSQTMGLSESETKKMVKETLDGAIETSKQDGSYNLPNNFGNIILGEETTTDELTNKIAEALRDNLQAKKADGVTDKNIRWWYNLNDVERNILVKEDDIHRMALFTDEIQKGSSTEEAAAKVRKFHVMYGNPNDTSNSSGDDRPLPFELKDRINIYFEKKMEDPEGMKRDIEKSGTMNAIIRREIKNNNI